MRIKSVRTVLAGIAALGFLAVGAVPAQAQGMMDGSSTWSVDGRGGIAMPVGDFSDLAIDDLGLAFGLGVAYNVHPRVAIRADGDVEMYGGSTVEEGLGGTGPDISLFHYNAGVEVELTRPSGPWSVSANVGGGATTWDTDDFFTQDGATEVSETYFTGNGGLRVGYEAARNVNVFLGGQWYMQFGDEAVLSQLPDAAPDFETVNSLPIQAGVELTF